MGSVGVGVAMEQTETVPERCSYPRAKAVVPDEGQEERGARGGEGEKGAV